MRYTRRLISFVILTMLVGLGFLVLSTDQARATENGAVCPVRIQKDADPADDTEFNFFVTGGNVFNTSLKVSNSFVFGLNSTNAPTTVTEDPPQGWILEEILCSRVSLDCGGPCIVITDAPNGLEFECIGSSDEITCIFFNVRATTPIPTLNQWGLIAMAGILGIAGFLVIRRRKVSA